MVLIHLLIVQTGTCTQGTGKCTHSAGTCTQGTSTCTHSTRTCTQGTSTIVHVLLVLVLVLGTGSCTQSTGIMYCILTPFRCRYYEAGYHILVESTVWWRRGTHQRIWTKHSFFTMNTIPKVGSPSKWCFANLYSEHEFHLITKSVAQYS